MEENQNFNINKMLEAIYDVLKEQCKEDEKLGLLFVFSKNIPRELRGDKNAIASILFHALQYILRKDCSMQLVLSIDAPDDFIHKEPVTFKMTNLPFKEEEILPQLQKMLAKELEATEASLCYTEKSGGSIEITMPLLTELGKRRYYRLPSKEILDKKILLIIKNSIDALSLVKMFKYFPIKVDLCIKTLHEDQYQLHAYDLIVLDEILFEEEHLRDLVETAQKYNDIKVVLYGDGKRLKEEERNVPKEECSVPCRYYLRKPVTQERIYDLLSSSDSEIYKLIKIFET